MKTLTKRSASLVAMATLGGVFTVAAGFRNWR
jgi:hypothetical protein